MAPLFPSFHQEEIFCGKRDLNQFLLLQKKFHTAQKPSPGGREVLSIFNAERIFIGKRDLNRFLS